MTAVELQYDWRLRSATPEEIHRLASHACESSFERNLYSRTPGKVPEILRFRFLRAIQRLSLHGRDL